VKNRDRIIKQPRLDKPRTPVGSAFMDKLEAAVEKECKRFGVSRSFVIAVAVAHSLGINEQPDYIDIKPTRTKVLRLVNGRR
jgi:hypothetical protein